MSKPIRHKRNDDVNLTTLVTDEKHNSVGIPAFRLSELPDQDLAGSGFGCDMFYDLEIYDGAGKTGNLLVEGAGNDYLLLNPLPANHELVQAIFDATGLNITVYTEIQIINAAYQACDLYFNYTAIADDNDAEDINNITPILITKSADYVQPDMTGFRHYAYICGAATKKHTLPSASLNKNLHVRISKADSGYGPVMIVLNGSDTIKNTLTILWLWTQGDIVELESDGVGNYVITNGFSPYFYTGWKSQSDYSNVHLGDAVITYDTPGAVAQPQVGDKITGANGSYGICVLKTATTAILKNVVCVGATIFANNEAISGDRSGFSALVNMASGLKNVDSYIYHGWGKNERQIDCKVHWSTDGIENNSALLPFVEDATVDSGIFLFQVDINNIKVQTAALRLYVMTDTGSYSDIAAADDYYNGVVRLLS